MNRTGATHRRKRGSSKIASFSCHKLLDQFKPSHLTSTIRSSDWRFNLTFYLKKKIKVLLR